MSPPGEPLHPQAPVGPLRLSIDASKKDLSYAEVACALKRCCQMWNPHAHYHALRHIFCSRTPQLKVTVPLVSWCISFVLQITIFTSPSFAILYVRSRQKHALDCHSLYHSPTRPSLHTLSFHLISWKNCICLDNWNIIYFVEESIKVESPAARRHRRAFSNTQTYR